MKTIISKELKRVFQDRKLIFSLFILPAIVVIGMYSLMGRLTDSMEEDIEQHISKIYIKNLPQGLDTFLKSAEFSKTADISYLELTEDTQRIEEEILKGTVDLLVVFEQDFVNQARQFEKEGDPIPSVALYYNTSGNYSSVAKDNFERDVLSKIKDAFLTERLGTLEMLTVFHTEPIIIVDEAKKSGETLAMLLPYFITFLLFVGAMSLGVDTFTGEKERGTMASMLLAPIKRQHIVMGKLISLSILSCISATVYAGAMIVAMPMIGDTIGGTAGSNVKFSIEQIVMLLATMLVMVFLYVALVSLVAIVAKTAKEAQTYVSPVYMVVIIAGLLTMFQSGREKPLYQYAIPVYGNSLAIQNLMTDELTAVQFVLSISGSLLFAVVLTVLLTRAFHSEKIMFNA